MSFHILGKSEPCSVSFLSLSSSLTLLQPHWPSWCWPHTPGSFQLLGFCSCWFLLIWDLGMFVSLTRQCGVSQMEASSALIAMPVKEMCVCTGLALLTSCVISLGKLEKWNLEIASIPWDFISEVAATRPWTWQNLNATYLGSLWELCLCFGDINQPMITPEKECIISS